MRLKYFVFIIAVMFGNLVIGETSSGYTEPADVRRLAFAESGIIESVLVELGDFVQAEQEIAYLYRSQIQAEVKIAEERVRMAALRYKRIQELFNRNSGTEEELIMAKSDLAIEELNVKKQQAMLHRHILTCPIDGVITSIEKKEGESVVGIQEYVFTVEKKETLKVILFPSSAVAQGLHKGQTLMVEIPQINSTAEGKISYIAPSADKASDTIKIQLYIDNKGGEIPAGIFCRIQFD